MKNKSSQPLLSKQILKDPSNKKDYVDYRDIYGPNYFRDRSLNDLHEYQLQTDSRSLKLIKIKSHLELGKTPTKDKEKVPDKDVSKQSKPSILNANLYKNS